MTWKRVILGVNWVEDQPLVRARNDDAERSELLPLIGLDLCHRASADSRRICVGHKPFRAGGPNYVDCRQVPQPGSRTCRSCAVVEATFASNLHHAHTKDSIGLDPAVAAHLRQPNLLYLAAFRDGSIKVGTSTEKRLATRLAEQGAWMARIVAWAPDGVTVRVLEDLVTTRLELPQSVSASRKLSGLTQPTPDDRLDMELDARRDDVHKLVLPDSGVGSTNVKPRDDRWIHPRVRAGGWDSLHPYPSNLASGAHELVVDDACGRFVVITRWSSTTTPATPPEDRFVADLQQLFGVEVEVGRFGSQPLAVQDSLF